VFSKQRACLCEGPEKENTMMRGGYSMKSSCTVFLAALIGFLLGAMLSRPNLLRASGGQVFLQRAQIGIYNSIQGSNFVGFAYATGGKEAECYIASQ